jgi:hypothetical protein
VLKMGRFSNPSYPMAKRMMQNEKSFDNIVVKKNQRTTIARENRKLRPDLMMNNLVIYTTTIWWSTLKTQW